MKVMYVYVLASPGRVLYTGVSSDLYKRMAYHRSKPRGSFTARYGVSKLVYYEVVQGQLQAIQREKQIKGWSRAKRVALIEKSNPLWLDLSADWFT